MLKTVISKGALDDSTNTSGMWIITASANHVNPCRRVVCPRGQLSLFVGRQLLISKNSHGLNYSECLPLLHWKLSFSTCEQIIADGNTCANLSLSRLKVLVFTISQV